MKELHDIVEEGVSEERAIQLTRETPLACRFAACIEDSIMEDGTVDLRVLEAKINALQMEITLRF